MKKTFLLTSGCYILCVVQAYLSMLPMSEEPSSTCWNCSLLREVLVLSVCIICIPLVVLLVRKIETRSRLVFSLVCFAAVCSFVDYSVYVSRVASWSTFTFREELAGTFGHAFPYILASALLSLPLFQYLRPKLDDTDNQKQPQH
ncbi:hypothetical protein [Parapedobacter tibetensis]|uniref:hypothetical protein n=1 Tax=Parapedobacter tibetensis TaxID=2972951 RepID=UPI00214D6A43|nr:hypothetical protein [Parapedobacter tibetensis]